MKNLFIGIDFSKLKIDVSFFEREKFNDFSHAQFSNEKVGYKEMLAWLKGNTKVPQSEWLFCGEHTGLYSLNLSEYLATKGFFIWVDTPLQIKRSMGIQRQKNDKADSEQLALYGFRYMDKAKSYTPMSRACKSLHLLYTYRRQLIKRKVAISQQATEMRTVIKRDPVSRYIYENSMRDICRLKNEIKDVEKKMMECIRQDAELYKNYTLLVSIKSIAFVNATSMIIHTGNFSRITDPRRYASYVGVVPFGKTSGTSVRIKPKVSNVANREIKALLTQAAKCAIKHNTELREYYKRKVAEGKSEWLVINNVKNKLIARCFAVIQRQEPYQEVYAVVN
jgi:transposase